MLKQIVETALQSVPTNGDKEARAQAIAHHVIAGIAASAWTTDHTCGLVKLIAKIRSGWTLERILEEEAKEFEYSFQRVFEGTVKRITREIVRSTYFGENQALFVEMSFEQITCNNCGESIFGGACIHPDTMVSVDINIPSGQLWLCDWFREDCDTLSGLWDEAEVTYTTPSGEKITLGKYDRESSGLNEYRDIFANAQHNVVSVFVGNTCPSIYQKGNTVVALNTENIPYNEDAEDDDGDCNGAKMLNAGFIRQGSVCTDLWRVTAVDPKILRGLLAKHRAGDGLDKTMESMRRDVVVNVEPGMYTLHANTQYCVGLDGAPVGSFYFRLEKKD